METTELIQLVTAISTALIAVCGVFSAIYWGYIPRKRQEKIEQLQKELFDCYSDIYNLLEIEKDYMAEENLSKKKTRENRSLTRRSEPKNVQNRIEQLKQLTK
jgi:hypothetical protein